MKRYWLLLVLPVLLLIWWGVDHGGSAPVLHFETVRRARIESMVSTNGKVEPGQWAAARAEIAGVVRSISVHQGEAVRAGQPLVSLDTSASQAELAAALARQQEARTESATLKEGGKPAQLASLSDSIRSAQSAEEVAQRNYEALQRLESHQAATALQVQEAKDALNRAKIQLSAAQNQQRTLVTAADRTVADAKLHDAQAAVALAQRRVSLGQIQAPISGTIYQFDLKIGAYLQPGDLVALVGDLDNVKVTVYVDEPDLGRVNLNMPVTITWDARPGQKWWGRVNKLPTQVVSLQARTVGEVTTVVSNPDHDLLPGVTVNATIISKVEDSTLSIPKAALRTIRGLTGVYRLQGDSLSWTPVKTGISDVNNVQILSGLRPGDRVTDRVIEPSDAEITNGMRVRAIID
jgi:RND family efflux transporter MFP subunit